MKNKSLEAIIFNDYLRDYSLEMGLSQATVRSKTGSLKRFMGWLGDKKLNINSCLDWVRSLHDKDLMPESIKHEVRVIRATLRFLYKRGFIKTDFASEIPYPKVPRTIKDFPPAEIADKIIMAGTEPGPGDNCLNRLRKEEHRQALKFILRTGLRNRELIDMKGADINLEAGSFIVHSKSGNTDLLPLPKDMLPELEKRINKPRLFEVTRETLNKSVKRGCERLQVLSRVRAHSLRHIFCTTLLKKGVPLQKVSRLMRHSSVGITDSVYSHYNIEDLRLALNGYHPLILQGMKPDDLFETIRLAIEATGVINDKRFQATISRTQDCFTFTAKVI